MKSIENIILNKFILSINYNTQIRIKILIADMKNINRRGNYCKMKTVLKCIGMLLK